MANFEPGIRGQARPEARATGEQGLAELLERFYTQLRRLARVRMRQLARSHTLETAEIVHDAYLRLQQKQRDAWDSRRHFFGEMSRAFRDVVVEHARRKNAVKRGGDQQRVVPETTLPAGDDNRPSPEQNLALLAALERFQERHPEPAEIVLLRYFGGFTLPEIASALAISVSSVERRWKMARAWLHRELS